MLTPLAALSQGEMSRAHSHVQKLIPRMSSFGLAFPSARTPSGAHIQVTSATNNNNNNTTTTNATSSSGGGGGGRAPSCLALDVERGLNRLIGPDYM